MLEICAARGAHAAARAAHTPAATRVPHLMFGPASVVKLTAISEASQPALTLFLRQAGHECVFTCHKSVKGIVICRSVVAADDDCRVCRVRFHQPDTKMAMTC